jgi:nitrogen fixation protein NifU and related proteins
MNSSSSTFLDAAVCNPHNLGELPDADSIGTVGSPECGDMLRVWIKFREEGGRKVIDRATFQTFGCQTALAVASVATELIVGKTAQEALELDSKDLAAPLGPLPPIKIHCAQLVESALRNALTPAPAQDACSSKLPSLVESLQTPKNLKITFNDATKIKPAS